MMPQSFRIVTLFVILVTLFFGNPFDLGAVAGADRRFAASDRPGVDQWVLFSRHMDKLIKPASITPLWLTDGSRFAFIAGAAGNRSAKLVDPETGTVSEFIDPARLRKGLSKAMGIEKLDGTGLPFTEFSLVGDTKVRFAFEGGNYLCDLVSYVVTPVPKVQLEAEARMVPKPLRHAIYTSKAYERLSPNGKWLATEIGYDLGLRSAHDNNVLRLTDDGMKHYRWDVTTVVWAADSSLLVVAKLDRRKDHYVPVIRWLQQEEQIDWYHYPKNGAVPPLPGYAIINPMSKQRVPLDLTGHEMRAIQPIGFRPGNDELFLLSIAGDGVDRQILAADVRTGKLRLILEDVGGLGLVAYERSALAFGAARLSLGPQPWADGEQFLDASDRDGTVSIYSYSYDGKEVARITPPGANIESIVGYDPEDSWLYVRYRPGGKRAYDLHLGRASTDGKKFEKLTTADGTHQLVLSPSKQYIIDTHSMVNRPPKVELLRADGSHVTTLTETDISRLKSAGWVAPEEFTALATDGETPLHGVIYFPPGFDPSKKYPVIDSIYNGPQTITHSNQFGAARGNFGRRALNLAQLGFVCVQLDSRGTPGRGRNFQEIGYGNMGQHEIPDHVAAIKEIAESRPYMDLDRVGISGYSYGGYMTLRGMLLAPDFYKVGVSGAPAVDHMDLGTFQSMIMGWPWDNPEGYAAGSNVLAASNLNGHLLMIHGTSDVNATFSTTMKMIDAFIRAGKPVDLLAIPEMDHTGGFNGEESAFASSLSDYLRGATARYLVEHLEPEGIDYRDIPLQ